ncbi:hypothetical protein MRX96_043093 [Rhipicephalus microplus]
METESNSKALESMQQSIKQLADSMTTLLKRVSSLEGTQAALATGSSPPKGPNRAQSPAGASWAATDTSSRRALALLLLEESSSSDSTCSSSENSSDSDYEDEAAVHHQAFDAMFRLPAKSPKVVGFVEKLTRRYSDDGYRHIHLSRRVMKQVFTRFAASSTFPPSSHGGVTAKSAETYALAFIWYAANKTSLREMASRFDLSESSV